LKFAPAQGGVSSLPAAMGFQARDAAALNALNHSSTDTNVDLTALARYTVGWANSAVPGMGRSVYVGVNVKF